MNALRGATFLRPIYNWKTQGDTIRSLLQEGHRALSQSGDALMTEILIREQGDGSSRERASYFLHHLDEQTIGGFLRVEEGNVTDLAIRSRFLGKGHEERILKLFQDTVSSERKRGITDTHSSS